VFILSDTQVISWVGFVNTIDEWGEVGIGSCLIKLWYCMFVVLGISQSCVSFSAFFAPKLSQLISVSIKMFLSRILTKSEPVTVMLWYSNNNEWNVLKVFQLPLLCLINKSPEALYGNAVTLRYMSCQFTSLRLYEIHRLMPVL